MPPPKHPNQKKKKKGHAPKHQNTFAFKHNPNSKRTEKITSSPNVHVCRRCHEKIEWRKQYRKYKPRTQPGRCNGCQKRNVLAAYHTICEACTRNFSRSKELIEEELSKLKEEEQIPRLRACAICVKEVALPDPEGEEDDLPEAVGRIRLRERKTIERQLMREAGGSSSDAPKENKDGDERISEVDDLANPLDDNDDDEDPFLKAVGGAGKLLTGEAYQKKLLQQQQP